MCTAPEQLLKSVLIQVGTAIQLQTSPATAAYLTAGCLSTMGPKWFEGQKGARHEQGCAQSTSERIDAHCEGTPKGEQTWTPEA